MSKSISWENGVKVIRELQPEELESILIDTLAQWRQDAVLTRIEMAYALLVAGILTQSEAEVFAAHGLPQPLAAMIEGLPVEAQPLARLKMFGAKEFPRREPEWDMLAASEGWPSEADIDAIFGWVEPQ